MLYLAISLELEYSALLLFKFYIEVKGRLVV